MKNRQLSRREFLAGAAALAPLAAGSVLWSANQPAPMRSTVPLVDMHVHLFGVLEKNGCWISNRQREHWTHPHLLRLLRLMDAPDIDEAYIQGLVHAIKSSSLNRAVLQAWDGRVNHRGQLDAKATSTLYVPNDYMFRIVRRFPGVFIPCASINPFRAEASDELQRCADLGARMVKIHPPTMDVDPSVPCLKGFYRICAARKIIVMVHTGHEHAAEVASIHNCDPAKLLSALEEGATVIAAHAGMAHFYDREKFYDNLIEWIPRFPNLYCDNSVLASMMRWRCLPQMLRDTGVVERMVHGSDYPFPPNALVFWNRVAPWRTAALLQQENLLERDVQLKRALGVPAEVFERGARLLGLSEL